MPSALLYCTLLLLYTTDIVAENREFAFTCFHIVNPLHGIEHSTSDTRWWYASLPYSCTLAQERSERNLTDVNVHNVNVRLSWKDVHRCILERCFRASFHPIKTHKLQLWIPTCHCHCHFRFVLRQVQVFLLSALNPFWPLFLRVSFPSFPKSIPPPSFVLASFSSKAVGLDIEHVSCSYACLNG